MSHRPLRIAAAHYALGLAQSDQLITAADDALNAGVYSYSLGELATFRNPTWADCAPLFVAAMEELEVPIPVPTAAIMTLLEFHLVQMVEGAASVEQTLHELYSLDRTHRYDPPVKVDPAVLKPLRPFRDQYYAVDEYHQYQIHGVAQGLPQLEVGILHKLHAEAIALAEDWCRNRWGSAINSSWFTSDVLLLAQGVNTDKAFDRLPILADALQEAGCENEELLDHLRNDGSHTRCCLFVNLLLGHRSRGKS